MAKTARPRASSFFDASTMKRLTGFFGASDNKGREGTQIPSPPIPPPIITNLSHQRNDSTNMTPTNGTPSTPGMSLSVPSPNTLVIPPRVESLTPLVDGAVPHPPAASLSPYLHPQSSSPVLSNRTSYRNFSGASAMSAISNISAASHTSYASSQADSSMANIPMPPSPTTAAVPKQLRRQRRGGIFGKKRKDDVEIPAAWRLTPASTEHLEGYNFGPLVRGDPVPDLWEPNGDTLVFLAPGNTNPKFAAPSFRITSSPLLFASLGQYIVDLQLSNRKVRPGSRPGSPLANGEVFLEVPSGMPSPATTMRQNLARPGSAPTSSSAQDVDFSNGPGALNKLVQQAEYEDENVAFKLYYPALELNPKAAAPTKRKKHKHSNSDTSDDSFQTLVDARNLFAFLSYNFLVSTLHRETPFQILEKIFKQLQGPISPLLHPEDRSPMDINVSRRIATAEGNFLFYVDELKIDDIRNDDEAIIEGLIMGERWKCQRLYREAFVHACGRWEELKGHSGCNYMSQVTKSRLDRASIDLHQIRLQNVTTRLTNFDYPSVWVGEGRSPEFKNWRVGFDAMRKFTSSYYKHVYGSWPPKAGKHGKGGGFTETGGLNRMVLKRLYEDFCALYDLLVDREWIHGDRIRFDANYSSDGEEKEQRSKEENARTIMRKIMSDFDQSYMPVQPNIPFDQPRLPYIPLTPPSTSDGKKKKKSKKPRSQKKLKSDELTAVLKSSYNEVTGSSETQSQFIAAYEKLEQDFGSGKNLDDITEARRGRWIFMYCVLQSLPMTVIDAIGCQYGDGVEYFLCENVKGSLPWERSRDTRNNRLSGIWGVTGQSPYGNLSAGMSTSNLAGDDEVEYTYRRSHCWDVAEDWRMVRGPTIITEESACELDGESGSEEYIEYRPLDSPLPDSPKETTPENPVGLSPAPPFRQSYPASEGSQAQTSDGFGSERSQTQSPPVGNGEGGYVAYHQQNYPRSQSQESNRLNSQEPRYEGYHPGTYHPGTYPESDRPNSYQSQQESVKIQDLPPFEFQRQQTEETLKGGLPMSPTHTEASSSGIQEQLDRAFSSMSTDSGRNDGR